ncbi:MAG: RluA family pseudouridine synthase [Gemmatimonadota bacterium]
MATEDGRNEERRIDVERTSRRRLDSLLAERLSVSRTRAAALIDEGRVRVNGAPARKSYRPHRGDRIDVSLPPPAKHDLEPEDLPLRVVYEDDDLLVVDKPAGLVVHPGPGHRSGTLVNALLHRTDRLSSVGGSTRPGIVHRLDRETSGLLIVARRDEIHRRLSGALARRKIRRGYLAAAWGRLAADRLTIDRPLGRDPRHRKRVAVVEGGRQAVTHVRRLESWRSADLLAVRLETGRTHQIRVHLRSCGHPLVGDSVYAPGWERGFLGAGGRWAEEFARRCGRLFLHAARLAFEHPRTGERIVLTSPLPESLASAVEWARGTS